MTSSPSNPRERILIVDDKPEMMEQIGASLREQGYRISIATGTAQALSVAVAQPPDLIIVDASTPGHDGFETCRQLRDNSVTRYIPILLLIPPEGDDGARALAAGATDFASHPIRLPELSTRVSLHLEMRRLRQEVRQAEERLLQIISQRDKIFSVISHDLRGPMSGVVGLSDLIIGDVPLDAGERKQFDVEMNKSLHVLAKLLENLNDWSRLQNGRMRFDPADSDLKAVVDDVAVGMGVQAQQKGISITTEIPPKTIVFIDRAMLYTVLQNVIGNAIKFSKEGCIITLETSTTETNVVLQVTDTGTGIHPQDLQRLFHLDAHLSTPGTHKERGTGLGLILCRDMMRKNNGDIEVHSEFGKGTTVYLRMVRGKE